MRFIIYLIGTIDGIKNIFILPFVASLVVIVFAVIILCVALVDKYDQEISDEDNIVLIFLKQNFIYIKIAIITIFLCLLSMNLIPSSKTITAMYLVPKIAQQEDVSKIPANAAKLLNSKLEEWVKEIDKNE